MKRIALFCLLILVVACASTPTRIKGTGQRTTAPVGWWQYCAANPTDPACKVPE